LDATMYTALERPSSAAASVINTAPNETRDHSVWSDFGPSSQASEFITDFPGAANQRTNNESELGDFTLSFVDESTNIGLGGPSPVGTNIRAFNHRRLASPELGDGSTLSQNQSILPSSSQIGNNVSATRNRLLRHGINLSPSLTPTPSPSLPSFLDSTSELEGSPCNTSTESAILQSSSMSRLALSSNDRYKNAPIPIRESSALSNFTIRNTSQLIQEPSSF